MSWMRNWCVAVFFAAAVLLGGCSGTANLATQNNFDAESPSPKAPPSALVFATKMRVAAKAMELGSPGAAARLYRSVLEQWPDRAEILAGLAGAMQAGDEYAAAGRETAERTVPLVPVIPVIPVIPAEADMEDDRLAGQSQFIPEPERSSPPRRKPAASSATQAVARAVSAPRAARPKITAAPVQSHPPPGPAAAEQPEAKNPGSEYVLQIAAFRTRAAAGRGLRRLKGRVADLLPGLHVVVRRADRRPAAGMAWRIRARAFAGKAGARDICARVTARGLSCLVVRRSPGVFITPAELTRPPRSAGKKHRPPPRRQTPDRYRVQLAAYRSLAAAERGRRLLEKIAPALLHGLDTMVRPKGSADDGRIRFRLRTAAFGKRKTADNLCAGLKARAIACIVVRTRL